MIGEALLRFSGPEYWQKFFHQRWNEVDQLWEWIPAFPKFCRFCCVPEACMHELHCPKSEQYLNTSREVKCLCCGYLRSRLQWSEIDRLRDTGVREIQDFYMFGRPSLVVCRYCALNYLLKIVDGYAITDDPPRSPPLPKLVSVLDDDDFWADDEDEE